MVHRTLGNPALGGGGGCAGADVSQGLLGCDCGESELEVSLMVRCCVECSLGGGWGNDQRFADEEFFSQFQVGALFRKGECGG